MNIESLESHRQLGQLPQSAFPDALHQTLHQPHAQRAASSACWASPFLLSCRRRTALQRQNDAVKRLPESLRRLLLQTGLILPSIYGALA